MAANKARIPLAKMAVEETGMGVIEDKVIKNHYASEYIYNKYRTLKTCGVIEKDDVYGMKDPSNIEARQAMCKAAYLGGVAINVETLGYGHSFGHTIGAFYGVTHGEALAITLPYVLQFQRDVCLDKLAELAAAIGLAEPDDTKGVLADKFIKACGDLRDELGLRSHLPEIKKEDYPKMIANVFRDSMSLASSLIALAAGVPLGVLYGSASFPGRKILLILNRTFMSVLSGD